jgi:hypothetical protein
VSPLIDIVKAPEIIATILTIVFSVTGAPFVGYWLARRRARGALRAHVADVVRDFRESVAVLESIIGQRRAAFPSDQHIVKVRVPPSLLTSAQVEIGSLPAGDARYALKLEKWLVNLDVDVATMLDHKKAARRAALDAEMRSVAEKLRKLSEGLLARFPDAAKEIETPSEPKTIIYDDGEKRPGIAWQDEAPAFPDPQAPFGRDEGAAPTA